MYSFFFPVGHDSPEAAIQETLEFSDSSQEDDLGEPFSPPSPVATYMYSQTGNCSCDQVLFFSSA